jgi:hypothetical protein
MVERHAPRRQVSPLLVGRKLDAVVASERLQRLDFDQRHLTIEVCFFEYVPHRAAYRSPSMPMPTTSRASESACMGADA